MKPRRLGLAAAVAFLALGFVVMALVWTAPADIAYRVLKARLGGWQAHGLSGSLWDGKAAQVALHGVPLGALEWRVSRSAFFAGTTRGDAVLRGEGILLQLSFERRGRAATLDNVTLTLPAQALAPGLALPGLVPLGTVAAKLTDVRLVDGYLAGATGSFEWLDVGVRGPAEGVIGDIEATFSNAAGGAVVLAVRDRNARIGVSGQVRFQGPAFELEVALSPRDGNLQIFEVLRLIGQRTADGGTLFRVRGRMQPLF